MKKTQGKIFKGNTYAAKVKNAQKFYVFKFKKEELLKRLQDKLPTQVIRSNFDAKPRVQIRSYLSRSR